MAAGRQASCRGDSGKARRAACSSPVDQAFDSPTEFASFSRDVLPPGMKSVIAERCGDDTAPLWAAVAESVAPFTGPTGTVTLPSTSLCARAEAP